MVSEPNRGWTRRWARDERGVTATELTVVATVMFVVLAAAYALYDLGTRTSGTLVGRIDALEGARPIDQIARELRQATPPADGVAPILTCQARDVAFYLDIDRDGELERIHYWAQGQVLYRGVTQPASGTLPPDYQGQPETTTVHVASLKSGWNGAIFTYYDNADPPNTLNASQADRASAVYVELQAEGKDPQAPHPEVTKVSTFVKIRSIYNSLD